MTAAWLVGMQRYCERRFAGSEVCTSSLDCDVFHGIVVKTPDGRRYAVRVEPDDAPMDVGDCLEDAMRSWRVR